MGTDNQRLVEQHMKAWSTGDVEGIVACLTEDCVFEDLGLQESFGGHDGIRRFAAEVFARIPDFGWIPITSFSDGDRVCTEWRFTGTRSGDFRGMPATTGKVDVPGVTVDEIRDGRIHRHRDYWSLVTMLQQVGLMPAAES